MKNSLCKKTILDNLSQIQTYREDCYLYSKILIFHERKETRQKIYNDLIKIQEHRKNIQNKLINTIDINCTIDDHSKNLLFSFTNKIYKMIKIFHQKLINYCPKIAEISTTSIFLQDLRMFAIENLTKDNNFKTFLDQFTHLLNSRYSKQIHNLMANSALMKIYDQIRRDQCIKNDKFLILLQPYEIQVFLKSHQKVIKKLQTSLEAVSIKNCRQIPNIYGQVMELSNETLSNQFFCSQMNLLLTFTYKEDGFCQFLVTKWLRMLKEMNCKNIENQKQINKFSDKYSQFLSKSTKQNETKNIKKFLGSMPKKIIIQQSLKNDLISEQNKNPALEVKTNLNISLEIDQSHEKSIQEQKNQKICDKQNLVIPEKSNLYKIQRASNKKKSFTLRPLTENKEYLHQTIIQMKLDQKNVHSKALRIRKKKMPYCFREEGQVIYWNGDRSKYSLFLS